jgi:hypothetical protein
MRPYALLTLSFLSLCAFAQSDSRTFIPSSPLTPAEVAKLKEKMKRDGVLSDASIEESVKDGRRLHTYRESDIFAAFPELRGARKLSECSNSIIGGATELVFISDTGKNDVTIKTVHCRPVAKGLSCEAVRRSTNYFLESPEHFFSLENLTFAQARPIVEAYQAGRITGLPDWLAAHVPPNVTSITAVPGDSYRMRFGDVYCSGCSAAFNVRLEASGTESRLVYVGDPQSACF